MSFRHVQCFEVVEVGFHLWALCNLETEPYENVFESFGCLSHNVRSAPTFHREKLGQIHAFG